jgi:N-acetyl-gamma-glutamyl-phosphate reductase|tara:strand:- start:1825 stop:2823 length:999 start_codon:yes stop_codon:yes gene_type:complete
LRETAAIAKAVAAEEDKIMAYKIFVDGGAGTTGLQILDRLAGRADIELLHLGDDRRKDLEARKDALGAADVSILCLPDDAAREAVSLVDNRSARLIDASTAHRTADGWVYGFPEYDAGQAELIKGADRVTNPGCYALGSVSMLHPLVAAGLLPADYPVTINAVSGYSGGGKSLIAAFEDKDAEGYTDSNYYLYGLGLEHKHTEEIRVLGGLQNRPLFVPSVGRFAQGMIVSLPLQLWSLPGSPKPADIHAALADHYGGAKNTGSVTVASLAEAEALSAHLDPEALNGTDGLTLYVFANQARGQALVCAVLDNLGKGAAGQAVQNLDLMLEHS